MMLIKKIFYLLLTQPLTPKAPFRFLELIVEYCKFDLTIPLSIIVDNPLNEESIFFKPPFHFIFNTDLEAVNRLVNLPFASTLIPLKFRCFKDLSTKFSKETVRFILEDFFFTFIVKLFAKGKNFNNKFCKRSLIFLVFNENILLIVLLRILLTKNSSLLGFFCFSSIFLITGNFILRKEAFKTLYNLLSLFLSFKDTACVYISLFKCIFFKFTIFNCTFLL